MEALISNQNMEIVRRVMRRFGRIREQGRASGVEVETRGAAIWTLREGKVIRLKIYQSSDDALKAVGLAE